MKGMGSLVVKIDFVVDGVDQFHHIAKYTAPPASGTVRARSTNADRA
jgi:hypothetical protein